MPKILNSDRRFRQEKAKNDKSYQSKKKSEIWTSSFI